MDDVVVDRGLGGQGGVTNMLTLTEIDMLVSGVIDDVGGPARIDDIVLVAL